MKQQKLGQIAEHISAELSGNPDILIESVATLESARPGQITFLNNKKYEPLVKTTKASAVILSQKLESEAAVLIAKDPYYAFMQAMVLLHGHRPHKNIGISKKADIASTANLGNDCNIHGFVTICDDAVIGNNCNIYPGVFIGPGTKIGDNCIIYPNVSIYDNCVIGSRVIIHSNASIGQDGFGFATHEGIHHKIPQIGRVILHDDVEIGSGCAIERGTLDDTIIEQGCKIGDMVAIGHGTKIGPHCLLVPQVGVAGSAILGHHCVLGGQVGIVGHIKIGNMVRIGAQAGVVNNIPDGATVVGAPAIDANKAKRAYSLIQYLPDIRKKIKQLEKEINKIKDAD